MISAAKARGFRRETDIASSSFTLVFVILLLAEVKQAPLCLLVSAFPKRRPCTVCLGPRFSHLVPFVGDFAAFLKIFLFLFYGGSTPNRGLELHGSEIKTRTVHQMTQPGTPVILLFKKKAVGHLAGSFGGACNSGSRGSEFKPHVGCRDDFKKKSFWKSFL